MTPSDLPTCETCRHWVESRLEEWRGKGVCTHGLSGPRPKRADVVRDLYVPRRWWCSDHERRIPSHLELREGAQ